MKIIVLAGGLSTERDVSLTSSAGICKTLIEKRTRRISFWMSFWDFRMHRKIWKTYSLSRDMDWRLQKTSAPQNRIWRPSKLPDRISLTVSWAQMSLNCAVWRTLPS